MRMFDYETDFNPAEPLWQRYSKQAEQQRQGLMRDVVDPFIEEKTGYVSPKAKLQRMAAQTDLSDMNSVRQTFSTIMSHSPTAAAKWIKSVEPLIKEEKKTSVDPVKQAKQARLNYLIAEKGQVEGTEEFLREEQRKKIQQQKASAGDTAYSKEAGKQAVERDVNLVTGAHTALKGLQKTQEVLDILDTGKVASGVMSEIDLLTNRLKSKFGGSKEALEKATNTQVLEAFLGSDVFPMIKQLGIGARGLDTPAEREFLVKVMTGDKSNELETIRRLTEYRQQLNQDIIDKYNKKLDSGGLDRYQVEFAEILKPIEFTKPRPSGAKRLVNDKTGEVIYQYPDGKFYTPDGKIYQ